MTDHSAAGPAGQPQLAADGAAFFMRPGIVTALYDALFAAPSIAGDTQYYDAACDRLGPRVLDAACGTGRIARALARPDRRLVAFDASPVLLARFRRALLQAPTPGPVAVGEGRLERPPPDGPFDAVILGYYGLAYLLDAGAREACLAALLHRLRPGGRLHLHLPRHDLLVREVPVAELSAMAFATPLPGVAGVTVHQDVEAMRLDRGIRSIAFRHRVVRDGVTLRDERSVMRLAAVPDDEIQALAAGRGARLVERLAGFRPGVTSETVYEIERV